MSALSAEELHREVEANPVWYHTMDLGQGVTTPGWFDLRPVSARLPWPDVRGKRCLDVGTFDGFFAFEMERRGAREVIATDIPSHADWDWPLVEKEAGAAYTEAVQGEKGKGFEVAAAALGSSVRREFLSVYDLDQSAFGRFDVVFCGTLLLHLKNPFRALEQIRSVCDAWFLSVEQIDLRLLALGRRSSYLRLNGSDSQWFIPNPAAHRRMIEMCRFEVQEHTRPFSTPFGPQHPKPTFSPAGLVARRLMGGEGIPTDAILSRPC
jgi:tRNA (mo5U34)-methyltransferase